MRNKFFSEEEVKEIIAPPKNVELLSYKYYTEDEIRNKLDEYYEKQSKDWYRYGKDGFVLEWEAIYKYRGIEYAIRSLKYYTFNKDDPLNAGLNKIGRHLVLKYTDNSEKIYDFIYDVFDTEILWKDTLHARMENWDIKRMIEYLHSVAKQEIDWLLDKSVKALEKRIKEIEKQIKELKKLIREIKRS
jgi:hypothetical protein